MAEEPTSGTPQPLRGLKAAEQEGEKAKGLPPVHLWNPPYCGAIDMRIRRDGTWDYMGSPIHRPALVRLFSTILRREPDGSFVLVTPVERVGIQVEDAPFVAVTAGVTGAGPDQTLTFTTNVGDTVTAGPEHALRVETAPDTGEPSPYVHIRAGLEALIARPVFYDLVDLGVEVDVDGETYFGVWSGGVFFPFAPARALQG